jgi:hypothetical protein
MSRPSANVFSGAGLSVDQPAGLPSRFAFRDRVCLCRTPHHAHSMPIGVRAGGVANPGTEWSMANTRFLSTVVEDYVRGVLARRHGQEFERRKVPLVTGGLREFGAVSEDATIVAIKTGRIQPVAATSSANFSDGVT